MGYRSEVLMRVESEDLKPILLEMALLSEGINWSELKQHWKENLQYDNTRIHLEIDQVKWYDGYKEIDIIEKFWSYLEQFDANEENYTIHGCFLRIGEDESDITSKFINEGWELGHVTSYIEVDYPWDFTEVKK